MTIRFDTIVGAAMLLAIGFTGVHAQDIKLVVDRGTGDLTLTGANSTVVDLAGYLIDSQHETLNSTNFNGLRDTETDWELAIANATTLGELNSNGNPLASTPVNNTVSFDLGSDVFDPTQAKLDAGFGVDVESLSLTYYDSVLNATRSGVIEYTGEKLFNNIGITVDLADGTAIIENESPFNQVITGYLIEASTENTLNTNLATFDGVGGSFQSMSAPDGENLGELDPTGVGIALNAGASINLGAVGGTLDDLEFSFILAGVGQVSRVGFVKYLNAGLPGDFNHDGSVNAADYVVWRKIDGSPGNYDLWRENFGNSMPGGGASAAVTPAVPEPTTWALTMVVACFMNFRPKYK